MKNNDSEHNCQVFHFDLYGNRNAKYEFLRNHDLDSVEWTKLQPQEQEFFFVPKDFEVKEEFNKAINIKELFSINTSGIKTHNDKELVSPIPFESSFNKPYTYRPLDEQWIDYDLNKVVRHRFKYMCHILDKENMSLIIGPQGQAVGSMPWNLVFCSKNLVDTNIYYRGGGIVFPLYLYPSDKESDERTPNLDKEIWNKINECVGAETTPEQVFDYIYGVLYTPSYREKYKEFLKVDFPRIPYPSSQEDFLRIAAIGTQLRQLHLMEKVPTMPSVAQFTVAGDNLVDMPEYREGCVFINRTQCFSNVPEVAWSFYIGGYQPAQKWLKDRKGRKLEFDDILHYRKIIAVLLETDRLMKELDAV